MWVCHTIKRPSVHTHTQLNSAERVGGEVARRRAAGALPFGQIPVAAIDGRVFAQSNALLRYFGREVELVGATTRRIRIGVFIPLIRTFDGRTLALFSSGARSGTSVERTHRVRIGGCATH